MTPLSQPIDPTACLPSPVSAATGNRLQSFGRFEFKYLVPQAIRPLLEAELREFMQVDPFCSQSNEQAYYVRSLYFDDPLYGDYYEKIDGLLKREKYRVRTYGRSTAAPHFLEIKGRQNHFTYKHRAALEPELLARIEAHDWIKVVSSATGNSVLARFAAAALRRNLRATLAVEYWRRPYISRLDYRFRATFDHDLLGLRMSRLSSRPQLIRAVLPGYTVLEIKFAQSVPAWFQRLIGAYELQRVSVSKYCRAAEALTLVQNLE